MGPVIVKKPYREILGPLPRIFKRYSITTKGADINTTSSPKPQPFRFLDLPRELRNRIYNCLLHKETRQRLGLSKYTDTSATDVDPSKGWLRWQYNDLQTAILATNHAVHDEAAAIMYGTQPFLVRITSFDFATGWEVDRPGPKMLISPRYMRLIKLFKVQVDLSNRRLGSSDIRENMRLLFSNIHSFCRLIKQNSLVRMEIEFNNLLLPRAQGAWPGMNVQLEGQETLEAFVLMGAVKNVVFTGDVQPEFALKLKTFMEMSIIR